jgi:hypothetical protein
MVLAAHPTNSMLAKHGNNQAAKPPHHNALGVQYIQAIKPSSPGS